MHVTRELRLTSVTSPMFILKTCYEEKRDVITTNEDTTHRFISFIHYYDIGAVT